MSVKEPRRTVGTGQFGAGIREAERAVELNPSNVRGRAILGMALDALGRNDEAIARHEQSIRLSPRDPRMSIYYAGIARGHLGARRYEEAAAVVRRTVDERPDFPHSHYILACALGHLGKYDEARAELAECEHLQPVYVERRLQWSPYKESAENEHLHAGVRAAQAAAA